MNAPNHYASKAFKTWNSYSGKANGRTVSCSLYAATDGYSPRADRDARRSVGSRRRPPNIRQSRRGRTAQLSLLSRSRALSLRFPLSAEDRRPWVGILKFLRRFREHDEIRFRLIGRFVLRSDVDWRFRVHQTGHRTFAPTRLVRRPGHSRGDASCPAC